MKEQIITKKIVRTMIKKIIKFVLLLITVPIVLILVFIVVNILLAFMVVPYGPFSLILITLCLGYVWYRLQNYQYFKQKNIEFLVYLFFAYMGLCMILKVMVGLSVRFLMILITIYLGYIWYRLQNYQYFKQKKNQLNQKQANLKKELREEETMFKKEREEKEKISHLTELKEDKTKNDEEHIENIIKESNKFMISSIKPKIKGWGLLDPKGDIVLILTTDKLIVKEKMENKSIVIPLSKLRSANATKEWSWNKLIINYRDEKERELKFQESGFESLAKAGFLGMVTPVDNLFSDWANIITTTKTNLINSNKSNNQTQDESISDILKKRYAKGEITKTEFEKLKKELIN